MFYGGWRGVVGTIGARREPGPLEELIRLLPEGIGVLPFFLGMSKGTEKEFLDVMDEIKAKIGEVAKLKVDLINARSAPPFMLRGFNGEQEIVSELEQKHGIPIVTSGMTCVEALKALEVKKMLGVTYYPSDLNRKYAQYFRDAGFEVLGMEGISVAWKEKGRLTPQEIYYFVKKEFLKHQNVQGIYMLGSGWRVLKTIQILENDLRVPVVQAVPARAWAIQRRLHVREPVKGYGRLLEEMP